MRANEIIIPLLEKRAQLKQQAEASGQPQPVVSAGNRDSIPNRPTKKKRKPYTGPVLMTFSLPPKQILLDTDPEK